MHLMQNAETINRLVAQGAFLLKSFHAEYKKDPAGFQTEFLRGDLAGWRDTLHTLYHDCAEEIVDRVVAKTTWRFPIAEVEASGSLLCAARITVSRMRNRRLRKRGQFPCATRSHWQRIAPPDGNSERRWGQRVRTRIAFQTLERPGV
jgi:hypothetical protein